MKLDRAIRIASKWSDGNVCSLREGEAMAYHELCLEALQRMRREQEELESKLRVLESSSWISVGEKLPERGKKVLCYMNYLLSEEIKSWGTCVTENTYRGVLVGSNPRKHVWEWQGDFVTHWMPLPEPPKEDLHA